MKPLLECIPNFSEGRDTDTLHKLAAAIRSVPEVALLHEDVSDGANRTVMTFAGPPQAVIEAAYRALKVAATTIDMRKQAGVHPRIGAVDVCPFVSLTGMTQDEAVSLVNGLAQRVGTGLNLPVYLYEQNSQQLHRKYLPQIRRGEYEGLAQKMTDPRWVPDYGPETFQPRVGATVMGVRNLLVAFNLSVRGVSPEQVTEIAKRLRETGVSGNPLRPGEAVRGRLPATRVIGWYQTDYDTAQLSMNLLDYRKTTPLQAYLAAEELVQAAGGTIIGSELIGLMPEACLLEAGRYRPSGRDSVESLVQTGIEQLRLDRLRPFRPDAQILEYRLRAVGLLKDAEQIGLL
ncbi:MAG: glutamate formimidoyltransferase [Sphingobacteriales bacterium]|nr:MAG: glutamate formimidoyltransferase [Sphingobacteriales bacterium]